MSPKISSSTGSVLTWTIIIVFALYVAYTLIAQQVLTKHFAILVGCTQQWKLASQASVRIKYIYMVDGKEKSGFTSDPILSYKKEVEFKCFPVVYNASVDKADLLITPADFSRYNLPFPDSLMWVKQLIEK